MTSLLATMPFCWLFGACRLDQCCQQLIIDAPVDVGANAGPGAMHLLDKYVSCCGTFREPEPSKSKHIAYSFNISVCCPHIFQGYILASGKLPSLLMDCPF